MTLKSIIQLTLVLLLISSCSVNRGLVHDAESVKRVNQAFAQAEMPAKPRDQIAAYDALITMFGDSADPEVQAKVAVAFLNKAALQPRPSAVGTYDMLINQFGNSSEPEVQVVVATAYVRKGLLLQNAEAILSTYDAMIAQFGNSTVPEVIAVVATVELKKRIVNIYLGRAFDLPKTAPDAKKIAIYNTVITKFGHSTIPNIQAGVAFAYCEIGHIQQRRLKQPHAAIKSYDAVIAKFDNALTEELQAYVAEAYFFKGVVQGRDLNDPLAEIASYDKLIAKFGNTPDSYTQARVARAYFNKGVAQSKGLKNQEAAIATYGIIIAKFGDLTQFGGTTYGAESTVALAYNGIGSSKLLQAKQAWGNQAKRLLLLKQALNEFNVSDARMGYGPSAHYKNTISINTVYTKWLLGERSGAGELLKKAFVAGKSDPFVKNNREVYSAVLSKTDAFSVPDDIQFRQLVEKVWQDVDGGNY